MPKCGTSSWGYIESLTKLAMTTTIFMLLFLMFLCKKKHRRAVHRHNAGPDLGSNCLILWWFCLKSFLNKQTTKQHTKFPSIQRVNIITRNVVWGLLDLFYSGIQLSILFSPYLCLSRFVFTRRWYIDKLGIFHANQTSICLDSHQK